MNHIENADPSIQFGHDEISHNVQPVVDSSVPNYPTHPVISPELGKVLLYQPTPKDKQDAALSHSGNEASSKRKANAEPELALRGIQVLAHRINPEATVELLGSASLRVPDPHDLDFEIVVPEGARNVQRTFEQILGEPSSQTEHAKGWEFPLRGDMVDLHVTSPDDPELERLRLFYSALGEDPALLKEYNQIRRLRKVLAEEKLKAAKREFADSVLVR